jgi:hypothetical protein
LYEGTSEREAAWDAISLAESFGLGESSNASWSPWPLEDTDSDSSPTDSAKSLRLSILRRVAEIIVCGSLRPLSKARLTQRIESRLSGAWCDITTRDIGEAVNSIDSSLVEVDPSGRYYPAKGFLDLDQAWDVMVELEDLVDLLSETDSEEEHYSAETLYMRDPWPLRLTGA